MDSAPTVQGSSNAANAPANWVDVKLHGITNLPSNWSADCGASPIYSDHVFRYEVDVDIAGVTHTFKNGRMLHNIPLYADYVETAKLPPVVSATVENDTDRDSEVPQEAIAGQAQVVQDRPSTASGQAGGPGSAGGEKPAAFDPSIPNALLWVISPEQELAEAKEEGTATGKPAAKGAKKGAAAPPPPPTESVKPIQPFSNGPPPCMVRIPLTLTQLSSLEEQVEKFVSLNFTFRRILKSGCPPDWEDTNEPKYQATIPVSLKVLAEPGSTTFTSTIPLAPVMTEAPKEDEKGKKKPAAKKTKGAVPAILQEDLDLNEPHPYTTNNTSATITVSCHSAVTRLPQSRPRPDLQPSDMIPRRLRPQRRPVEATKAYTSVVEGLVAKIVEDQRAFTAVNPDLTGDEARSAFLAHLATSGKSHAYKELLIPGVASIVREKFMRKPNPSKEEMDRVANELYTYLVDHMHNTLNKTFSKDAEPAPAALEGSATARWKRLAMEAEVMQEFAIAAKYHQERLVQCGPNDGEELADIWCEYAEFCLRVRDVLKAEQAYREALALDFCHLPSLIGYGLLLLSRGRYKESEVFLQSAVDISANHLTWGCVALYYESLLQSLTGGAEEDTKRTGYKREAKYAMTQAARELEKTGGAVDKISASGSRLNAASMLNSSQGASSSSKSGGESSEDVYLSLAQHVLDLYHEELAGLCLNKVTQSANVNLLYAKLFSQTAQNDEAISILKQVIQEDNAQCQGRLLLGDIYANVGKSTEAEQQYDAALRIDPNGGNGPAYVRLGNMYTALGKFKDALSAFLMAAKVWPCGLSWLGVGISYYRMEDMTRAEQALNESNILNNLNPKTWAYLALLCLRQKREDEGDQAFNQAIKQGLADHFLIAEVGAEQLRLGRHSIAEACFMRSLALQDDCNTRMYLGRTFVALRRLQEAKEEFQKVSASSSNEVQKAKAEEQIQQINQSSQTR